MLILSLKLSDQIDCAVLCKKIQDSLIRVGPIHNTENKLLTITISDIIDSQQTIPVSLIEHKQIT